MWAGLIVDDIQKDRICLYNVLADTAVSNIVNVVLLVNKTVRPTTMACAALFELQNVAADIRKLDSLRTPLGYLKMGVKKHCFHTTKNYCVLLKVLN